MGSGGVGLCVVGCCLDGFGWGQVLGSVQHRRRVEWGGDRGMGWGEEGGMMVIGRVRCGLVYGENSDHKVTSRHRGSHEIHFKCGFSYICTTFQK